MNRMRNDIDDTAAWGDVFKVLPGRDKQLIRQYMEFATIKHSSILLIVITACIAIGLVGNICFLFFFGNKATTVYLTRDAIYIRRMSAVDILICVVVLPYIIFYEDRMIGNNIICKAMEYTRHTLTYMSHLLLTSYSMEFAKCDSYTMAKERLNKASKVIILVSLALSMPVLFIFEAGSDNNAFNSLKQNKTTKVVAYTWNDYFRTPEFLAETHLTAGHNVLHPGFCHMGLNYNSKSTYFKIINILESLHILSFGLVFFLCMAVIISNFIKFMESNPLIGHTASYVSVIVTDNPEVSEKLRKVALIEAEKKKQRRQEFMYLLHESIVKKRLTQTESGPTKQNNRRRKKSAASSRGSITSTVNPTKKLGARGQTVVFDTTTLDKKSAAAQQTQKLPKKTERGKETVQSERSSNRQQLSEKEQSVTEIESLLDEQRTQVVSHLDQGSKAKSSKIELDDERRFSDLMDEDYLAKNVSLVGYVCTCQCFKKEPKGIRKLSRKYPLVEHRSYKRLLMWLMLVDALIICMSFLAYVISNEKSIFLNLVHFKSVFAFYIISFTHSELRCATWGAMFRRETVAKEEAIQVTASTTEPREKTSRARTSSTL